MTVKINADTSDGLKFVSDTSGTVDIQSNGTTVAQVTSSSIVGKQDIILDAGKEFCINAADDVHIGRATTDRMTFNTGGTEAARIDENGNFGIGTDSPQFTLDVSGDTRMIGNILMGSYEAVSYTHLTLPTILLV